MEENRIPSQRLPSWLIRPSCKGKHFNEVRRMLSRRHLHTVCQSALCPNQSECFSTRTATFMIMGNTCTRNCRFCAVEGGCPEPLDENEPMRIAEATAELELKHVVITSVTRDDVPDGGANHFAQTINAVHRMCPATSIEVLVPDFLGSQMSLEIVVKAKPDVFNHNVETVPRLYKEIRPGADYQRSLEILKTVKELDQNIIAKSGVMVGLGETRDELLDVMGDLCQVDCDFLTIGQYLRPSKDHAPVMKFFPPEVFSELEAEGKKMGFRAIASAPFVRSSYKSGEFFNQLSLDKKH